MTKKDFDTFNLNVRFCVTKAAAPNVSDHDSIKITTDNWIDVAERLFDDKPKLKIHPRYEWNVADIPVAFKRTSDYRAFMNSNYDNIVGEDKTEGALVVLVADRKMLFTENPRTLDDEHTASGHSFSPHCQDLFERKTGIFMFKGARDSAFAHELGHMLSLKHTWERYVGLKQNCNKDFPKGETGQGGTRGGKNNKTINLMDYGANADDFVILNECQKERAAHQRRMYMTTKGETNYRNLKGLS